MENKTVDLQKMSLMELKALAYDLLSQREGIQNNLNMLNNEIALRIQHESTNNILKTEKVS